MAIEKITNTHPIFQTSAFLRDMVSFNVMLVITEQPNSQCFSNGEDMIITMSPEQDTVWAWTLTDLPAAHREELWQFIEYLCMGKKCRVFLKSVLVQRAALDKKPIRSMFAYHCKSLLPVSQAHGDMRPATQNELYMIANLIEQCDNVGKDAAIEKAKRYLERHTPYLWTDSGDSTVALAVLKSSIQNYMRIGGVYTRPDCRSMGYERTLIYRLTESVLASGRIPMLYASDQKSGVNTMYTSMGYVRCGKIAVLEL